MPIRTHRGRAAVYRTLWGWPLRSPWHLVAALVVLAAVGVGIATALPGGSGSSTTATAPSTERANPFDPASRSSVPGAAAPSLNQFAREATPEALSVADGWARAYLTTPEGMTSEQWVEQLRPHSLTELVPELRTVDPANVPDARVAGPPRTVSASEDAVEVDVPTSALVLRLSLVSTPAGWRVSGYERAG
ncbi:MAG: hypothetical protein GEV09_20480 [Pseudonocardiaceae bacterium]|nr:hypothetical protein [Pseudonocardiaceae bacterium]